MLIVFGVIILTAVGGFFIYLYAIASAWRINTPDERPFFITTTPIVVKKIGLPVGTKLIYEKQYFWEKHKQKEPLNEKDIVQISFKEGTTINWGGVPITSIERFYNSKMKGFTVFADFDKLNYKSRFSDLWQNGNERLGISIEDEEDWSFNKKNIVDVNSCGVNYQRYFKDDENQQKYLDDLHSELMKVQD